jgi:hypothetical protein
MLLLKYGSGDQIMEDEIGGTCGMHVKGETCITGNGKT